MKLLNSILLAENVQAIAQYDIERKKVFGSAYFVYQENNLAFEACYGTVSIESGKRVTNDTLFRLASMTKPITAI